MDTAIQGPQEQPPQPKLELTPAEAAIALAALMKMPQARADRAFAIADNAIGKLQVMANI